MATDHLDRKRGILRGCPGQVVAWVWAEDGQERGGEETGEQGDIWNKLPACVLARFQTKETWRIDGLDEDNVYPVAPQKKPWYLDKGRRRPMLRVSRRQFPLAPAFATTAHAAQGQTFQEGVVMDMHIGEAGDPLTAYIALTRVRDRHGLFVYRAFEASPFQKGAKVGRDLLLRWWSGEKLDWPALRAKYRDERDCTECHEGKPASAFTVGRWKRTDAARVCRECIKRHVERKTPWQCMACNAWKEEEAFPAEYARPQCTFYRVCGACESTKVCSGCGLRKAAHGFSKAASQRTRQGARLCLACASKAQGFWTCSQCQTQKRSVAFQQWSTKYRKQHARQVCDQCWAPRVPRTVVEKARGRVKATRRKIATEKRDKVVAEVMALIKRKRDEGRQGTAAAQGCAPTTGHGEEGLHLAGEQEPTKKEPKQREKKPRQGERQLYQYTCPVCERPVGSATATGAVDHRHVCGTRFRVRKGKVTSKEMVYKCPFCEGEVRSSARTGLIDHRRACGKQFRVKDGVVTRDIRREYECPFCAGHVRSSVSDGQVNHRNACGNQFYVKDGVVSRGTRHHKHKCPRCGTTVWSSQKSGRIRVKHKTAAGWLCAQHSWTAK